MKEEITAKDFNYQVLKTAEKYGLDVLSTGALAVFAMYESLDESAIGDPINRALSTLVDNHAALLPTNSLINIKIDLILSNFTTY